MRGRSPVESTAAVGTTLDQGSSRLNSARWPGVIVVLTLDRTSIRVQLPFTGSGR